MRKLILMMVFTVTAVIALGQATPSDVVRIANATTDLGRNMPVGSKIYNVADSIWYVVVTAAASTDDLTSAPTKFKRISKFNLSWDATNHQVDIDGGGTSATIPYATPNVNGLMTESAYDSLVTVYGWGNYKSDTANNVRKWIFDAAGDLIVGTGVDTYTKLSKGTANQILQVNGTGTALEWTTPAATHNAVTIQTPANGLSITAGQVLHIDTASATTPGALLAADWNTFNNKQAAFTSYSESFEEDDGTPTQHTLAHTPISGSLIVEFNGSMLKAAEYTLATDKLTIGIPVYQYDRVLVHYRY